VNLQLAKSVLHDSEREALLKQMAVIYPRSLQEVDPVTLARARKEYAKSVQKLLQEEKSAPAGVRHLCEAELLALVLKIAFSSFMGGIYVAGAMFNHSCRPNVISQPRPNKAPGTCMMVTRAVKEGEELCFSYLSPLEQSYRQRQKKFDFQHLSELAPSPWPAGTQFTSFTGTKVQILTQLWAAEMEAFSADIEHRLAEAEHRLAGAAAAANCGGRAEGQNDGAREGAEDEEEDEAGELTREEAEAHLCHMQDVLDRSVQHIGVVKTLQKLIVVPDSVDESTAAKESDAKSLLKDVWDLKEEAEGLLHSRNIVLCRINNTAVRLAHQLLVERPHAQWAIAMLQVILYMYVCMLFYIVFLYD